MNIDDMIAVLEAAKRGEDIEAKNPVTAVWEPIDASRFNFFDYRIAPKPQMTLVEELREMGGRLRLEAADRIEELESRPYSGIEHRTTDELLAEIARRCK